MRRSIFSVKGALLGLGAGIVFRNTIRTMATFEESLLKIQATLDATSGTMRQYEETARDIGATTRYTATEAANSLYTLTKAGFDLKETIAAARPVMTLATIGELDLAEAADVAAKAIRAFKLDATETEHVVDVFFKASTSAATTVRELAEAFRMVAPIAASVDISLEETSAALAILADRGLSASLGGTALRGALIRLQKPTSEAETALARLGVSVQEVDPRIHSLSEIFTTLGEKQNFANEAANIFEDRQLAAAVILADNYQRLERMSDSLVRVGNVSDRAAKIMESGLLGVWRSLKSAFDELIITAGKAGFLDSLKNTLKDLTEYFRSDSAKNFFRGLGEAAGQAVGKLTEWAKGFLEGIIGIGKNLETITNALGGVSNILKFIADSLRPYLQVGRDVLGGKALGGGSFPPMTKEQRAGLLRGEDVFSLNWMPPAFRPGAASGLPVGMYLQPGNEMFWATRTGIPTARQLLLEEPIPGRIAPPPSPPHPADTSLPPWMRQPPIKQYGPTFLQSVSSLSEPNLQDLKRRIEANKTAAQGAATAFDELAKSASAFAATRDGVLGVADSIVGNLSSAIGRATMNFKNAGQIFKEMVRSMAADIATLIPRLLLFRALSAGLTSLGFGGGTPKPDVMGTLPFYYAKPPGMQYGGSATISGPMSGYPVSFIGHGTERFHVEPLGSRRGGGDMPPVNVNIVNNINATDAQSFQNLYRNATMQDKTQLASLIVNEIRRRPGLGRA